MDAFQHIKNSSKSVTGKFENVDTVLNSNDKGLQMMRYVRDLHNYIPVGIQTVYCCWAT